MTTLTFNLTYRDPSTGLLRSNPIGGGAIQGIQLAAGHFVPQQNAMEIVSPRPDSETGSFATTLARHRWAYYDGINPIQYEFPLKVYGGAAPHKFQILSAPSGATIEAIYGDATRHGIVKWNPSQAYSTTAPAEFIVRIIGQDGNFKDFAWTTATGSTDKFIFISPSGNDTTGDGSFAAPFRSLAKMFGASKFTTTYPGKIVIMRGGSYATIAHSDGGGRAHLRGDFQPVSYIVYPGETTRIDMTAGEIYFDGDDNTWGGTTTGRMQWVGSTSSGVTAEAHNIWVGETSKRTNFYFCDTDAFVPRVAGDFTNSCPIFMHQSNTNPDRQYTALHDVQEINRTVRIANDGYITVAFGTKYLVLDYCGNGSDGGTHFKDTNYFTSVRYINMNNPGFALSFSCQTGSDNNEICFSKLKGRLFFNFQDNASTAGAITEFRNTIYTTDTEFQEGLYARTSANMNYKSINSVVISPGAAIVSSLVAVTNDIASLSSSADLPISTSTLLLVNNGGGTAWRTNNLGTRGHEVS